MTINDYLAVREHPHNVWRTIAKDDKYIRILVFGPLWGLLGSAFQEHAQEHVLEIPLLTEPMKMAKPCDVVNAPREIWTREKCVWDWIPQPQIGFRVKSIG